ncbi:MAG: hypothetical protein ACRD4B_06665 [Acidobacteriota bacterium]
MRFLLFITVVIFSAAPVVAAEPNSEPEPLTVTCRVLDQETGTVTEETMQLRRPKTVKACEDGKIVFVELPAIEQAPGAAPVPLKTEGEKLSAE